MLFFLVLILITWICNRFIHYFPQFLSKLFIWWGLGAIGDPFLIMVVDIAMRETKGEIFKLSNYYEKASSAGFAGAIIVIIIYGFLFMLNLFILYNYIIFHHFDGRL